MDSTASEIHKIVARFDANLNRVSNLLKVYEESKFAARKDILRAAVVLLHASMEDAIRATLRWHLPTSDPALLASFFKIEGKYGKRNKFTIVDLLKHRGHPVNGVISTVVNDITKKMSISNGKNLKRVMLLLGMDQQAQAEHVRNIAPICDRRHQIVHESDREEPTDTSLGDRRKIGFEEVQIMHDKVEWFMTSLLSPFTSKALEEEGQ